MRKLIAVLLLPMAAYATAPTVVTTQTSATNSNSTSQSVTLPGSLVNGNLLVCAGGVDGTPTHTWPMGWSSNELADTSTPNVAFTAAWRIVDGSESSPITVTATASEQSVFRCWQISGHDAAQAPQIQTAVGSTQNPNPPSISPTGGSKDYLFLALAAIQDGTDACSAFPSGYSNTGTDKGGGATGQAPLCWGEKAATASSEDPGTFTSADSGPWVAATIAIHPATAVAATFTAGPTVTSITTNSIAVSFTSDANGTVKGTACTNGNAGNKAETLAGQCSGGGAAVATISEAVTAGVGDSGTFTGLSAGTTYDLGFVIDAATDSDLESIADQTTEAAVAFDTVMGCSALDEDTFRCTYDANATADDIFVCVKVKDAAAPANGAAVEAGTGCVATATEATTGSSDSIDIDIPGGDPFPIYDIYGALKEDGGTYTSVDQELDEQLDPPTGRQYVTKSGAPDTGEEGLLDDASPAAADGDIMDVATHADSFAEGGAVHAITVNADTTFEIDAAGDTSQHKFTRRFYDVSVADWSDSSPVLYCVNNLTATYLGPNEWEGDVPFLFEKDAAASLSLDSIWEDPEGDSLTHNILNLPSGFTEDGEDLSGTPDTFGYFPTVELQAFDECGDESDETVQFIVGYRIPDIFAWLQTEESWRTRNIFEAIDADYVAAFGN